MDSPPPEIQDISSSGLILRFITIPAMIIGLGVALYLAYSAVASQEKTLDTLLDDLGSRGINKPWQAAFELARRLNVEESHDMDPRFIGRTIKAFDASKNGDPRIRCFLALALANMQDSGALNALVGALQDPSSEVRIHAILALGMFGNPEVAPDLMRFLDSADIGEIKSAICALGMLKNPIALERLRAFLHSEDKDIQWNTALALANFNEPKTIPILVKMLDRQYLASTPSHSDQVKSPQRTAFGWWGRSWPFGSPVPEFDDAAQERVIKQALIALTKLKATEAIPKIKQLLKDSSPEVEWQAALALVEFSDASGVKVLESRLERRALIRKGYNHTSASQRIKEALHALQRLKRPDSIEAIKQVQEKDLDPQVRKLAGSVLATVEMGKIFTKKQDIEVK